MYASFHFQVNALKKSDAFRQKNIILISQSCQLSGESVVLYNCSMDYRPLDGCTFGHVKSKTTLPSRSLKKLNRLNQVERAAQSKQSCTDARWFHHDVGGMFHRLENKD